MLLQFGFYGPSRLFHLLRPSQLLGGTKMRDLREKQPDHLQAELGLSHVTRARLNHSATGVTYEEKLALQRTVLCLP